MANKLIFLDIDGTLCPKGSSTPPPSALRAIREAQSRGHRVFLSTGRTMAALAELMGYGFDGAITAAGGHVELAGEVVYDHPMPRERRESLIGLLAGKGVLWVMEGQDRNYGPVAVCPEGVSEALWSWWQEACKMLSVRDISEYQGQPVYKLVVAADGVEQVEGLRQAVEQDFQMVFQPTGKIVLCELISRAFHKGQGVIQLCRALGGSLEDTVCIGDSLNDREMMEVAGISVAMEDGDPELKKLCRQTCPCAMDDGIEKAFRALGLIE